MERYKHAVLLLLGMIAVLALSFAYSRRLSEQLLIDELEQIPTLEETQ